MINKILSLIKYKIEAPYTLITIIIYYYLQTRRYILRYILALIEFSHLYVFTFVHYVLCYSLLSDNETGTNDIPCYHRLTEMNEVALPHMGSPSKELYNSTTGQSFFDVTVRDHRNS